MVDDSKEKDKGKKTLKRSLTSIVKKLKSIESTFRETSRPNQTRKMAAVPKQTSTAGGIKS